MRNSKQLIAFVLVFQLIFSTPLLLAANPSAEQMLSPAIVMQEPVIGEACRRLEVPLLNWQSLPKRTKLSGNAFIPVYKAGELKTGLGAIGGHLVRDTEGGYSYRIGGDLGQYPVYGDNETRLGGDGRIAGAAAENISRRWNLISEKKLNVEDIHFKLNELAEQGDEKAVNFIRDMGEELGRALKVFFDRYAEELPIKTIVLAGGIGEVFGKNIDGRDVFVEGINSGLDGLKIKIVRSDLNWIREIIAFPPDAQIGDVNSRGQRIVNINLSIGGTKLGIGAVNAKGEFIVNQILIEDMIKKAGSAEEARKIFFETIIDKVMTLKQAYDLDVRQVHIAWPGQGEYAKGVIHTTPNICWQDEPIFSFKDEYPLIAELSRVLSVKYKSDIPLFLEHDAAAAALGEALFGKLADVINSEDEVGMLLGLGSGVGAGFLRSTPYTARELVSGYFDFLRTNKRISNDEMDVYKKKLREFDFSPYHSLIKEIYLSNDTSRIEFLTGVLAVITAGYSPILVSDFNDTLTLQTDRAEELDRVNREFTAETARHIREILELEGSFTILSATTMQRLEQMMIDTAEFNEIFSSYLQLLGRFYLLPNTGTEDWKYSDSRGKYILLKKMQLSKELSRVDGHGKKIKFKDVDPRRGPRLVERYKEILSAVLELFKLEDFLRIARIKGEQIEDRTSQINIQVMGKDAEFEVRNAYSHYEQNKAEELGQNQEIRRFLIDEKNYSEEDLQGLRINLRDVYCAFVNRLAGQVDLEDQEDRIMQDKLEAYAALKKIALPAMDVADEARIPIKTRRGGRNNMEGVLLGMDKGYGIRRIAQAMEQPLWTIVYCGDNFKAGSNDRPVLPIAGISINVGEKIGAVDNAKVIHAKQKGPEGLFEFFKILSAVLLITKENRPIKKTNFLNESKSKFTPEDIIYPQKVLMAI
ncbi:MAG: ROK family protein [Candidatus Omnitrophica bacterium]|nr:ROK family protein [Candidatus Omnitrophota bacterium]